jgi:putative cardiolipin synthase
VTLRFLTGRLAAASITFATSAALLLMLSGCATVRHDVPRVPSHAISDGDRTTAGRVFGAQANGHPGLSGFRVLAAGRTAFVARAALADIAERSLDLQYYSVGEDLTTDLLLLSILDAADRGVRVRILLDDLYPATRHFARRAAAAHTAVEVRLFNPFYFGGTSRLARLGEIVFDGGRLNRRMHNKLWLTDNAAAVIGSRNLGDEYFDASGSANFSDVDLLAVGPVVRELSQAFDAYWNSASAVPAETFAEAPDAGEGERVRKRLRELRDDCAALPPCESLSENKWLRDLKSGVVPLTWAHATFMYDEPDQDKVGVLSGIEHGWIDDRPGGDRTRAELLIASPYFIPSEDGRRHIGEMHERGVRVAVLTDSLASTDSPAAHAGYARHRVALVRTGIELYELRPAFDAQHPPSHRWRHTSPFSLHAKIVVQDRARAIVGSLNQDPRSRLHNTEGWLVLESPVLAAELAALFEEGTDARHAFKVELNKTGDNQVLVWSTEEDGKPVRYESEPMSTPWQRLWRGLLGKLIPEHLL